MTLRLVATNKNERGKNRSPTAKSESRCRWALLALQRSCEFATATQRVARVPHSQAERSIRSMTNSRRSQSEKQWASRGRETTARKPQAMVSRRGVTLKMTVILDGIFLWTENPRDLAPYLFVLIRGAYEMPKEKVKCGKNMRHCEAGCVRSGPWRCSGCECGDPSPRWCCGGSRRFPRGRDPWPFVVSLRAYSNRIR
jgi:hypothetical protein